MLHQFYTPALACVILDIQAPNSPELFLSVNSDFSIGKLFRTGLDSVYGFVPSPACVMHGVAPNENDAKECKEYDAKQVRRNICSVEEHRQNIEKNISTEEKLVKCIFSQGHGNLGLNNWAVAYTPPYMVIPAREPIFERIYPSFIKTKKRNQPSYEIANILYCYDLERGNPAEILDWNTMQEIQKQIVTEHPDREVSNNAIYLPVWDENLQTIYITEERDQRIDYSKLASVRFVKLIRNQLGTIVDNAVLAVKVTIGVDHSSYSFECEKIENLEFAFFGIPVNNLVGKSRQALSSNLKDIVHYFYDIRHLFDLGQLKSTVKSNKSNFKGEFYLFEYALKKDNFAQIFDLLSGNKKTVEINISALSTKLQTPQRQLLEALKDKERIISSLTEKGYVVRDKPEEVTEIGDFCLYQKNEELWLEVSPFRNVYPYSFIGILENQYLIFGVTHGASGIRSAKLGEKTLFKNKNIKAGLPLEDAVTSITNELLKLNLNVTDIQWNEDSNGDEKSGLLLLDQGGDVHQWFAMGGLKNIVGSSEDRAKLAAELVVSG